MAVPDEPAAALLSRLLIKYRCVWPRLPLALPCRHEGQLSVTSPSHVLQIKSGYTPCLAQCVEHDSFVQSGQSLAVFLMYITFLYGPLPVQPPAGLAAAPSALLLR